MVNTGKRKLYSKKIIPALQEEGLFYRVPTEAFTEELEVVGKDYDRETFLMPTEQFLLDLHTKYKSAEIEMIAQKSEQWVNDTEPVRRSKLALLYTLKDSLTGIFDEQTIHDCCDFLLAVNPSFGETYKRVE